MVAYQQFVELSVSSDSQARGQAAHLAAAAFLNHSGPADEQAALYAALIGFLDDSSVKVRAALAYGLLHAAHAPRPILLALLHDAPVIARAVAQYSPALIDADLVAVLHDADEAMMMALAQRERLSGRVGEALLALGSDVVRLAVVRRRELHLPAAALVRLTETHGDLPLFRGAILARGDLPGTARLTLIGKVRAALAESRIVRGSVAKSRLERVLRNAVDTALVDVGEADAPLAGGDYAGAMIAAGQVNARVLLHALAQGRVLFFAACLAELAETPRDKVLALLEAGSRAALNALLARAGLGPAIRNLMARMVFYARSSDLGDDVTARHFIVTALTEELISDHDGDIPEGLSEAFSYLCEQNIMLARQAARGVMPAFAGGTDAQMSLPSPGDGRLLALPAA
jgi:uncharacterized protein (DUF2336 family)